MREGTREEGMESEWRGEEGRGGEGDRERGREGMRKEGRAWELRRALTFATFGTGISAMYNIKYGMILGESMTINSVFRCVVMYYLTDGGHDFM